MVSVARALGLSRETCYVRRVVGRHETPPKTFVSLRARLHACPRGQVRRVLPAVLSGECLGGCTDRSYVSLTLAG
jgi:hypothetical protein